MKKSKNALIRIFYSLVIDKDKVEECVDEKILLSDEDPATNNKEEAKVWNDVKHCQATQSTQRFACRRQTILMLRNSKIETSFMLSNTKVHSWGCAKRDGVCADA